MDKYEYRVKTEQMLEHYEKKQFRKAMEIADTIDWRRSESVHFEISDFEGTRVRSVRTDFGTGRI